MRSQIAQSRQRLQLVQKHPLLSSPYNLLSQRIQQLDAMRNELELLKPSSQVEQLKEKLATYPSRFATALGVAMRQKKTDLIRIESHLRSLNPKNILKKGYSILFSEKNVILSAKELNINQPFTVLLHDGRVAATANQIEENGNTLI
jgi:exodeoxyribonuclease VII large subunit